MKKRLNGEKKIKKKDEEINQRKESKKIMKFFEKRKGKCRINDMKKEGKKGEKK